jgi:hypothetical protein
LCAPYGNYCTPIIKACQEVFLWYNIIMDMIDRIGRCLFSLRACLRKIHGAIQEQTEAEYVSEERNRNKQLVGEKVRTIVSFDEETVRTTKTEADRQHATQESIKKATQYAVVAASIYALISILIWCQMIKQNKIANAQLRQSIESFRIDERAWIEIQPIALPSNPAARLGAFRYELYPKNVGKTAATDIKIYVPRGSMDSSITLGDNAPNISRSQDMLVNGALSDIPRVNPISKVLAPNTVATVPFIMDGQAPQYFSKDEWVSYLIGRIDYTDAFNIPHWLKFCFFVVDARGTLWNCKEGNDEDRNPELPPN